MFKRTIAFVLMLLAHAGHASVLDFELLEAQPREVYYFSTPGKIILLHGDITTPILDNRNRRYFSLVKKEDGWHLNNIGADGYQIGSLWSQVVAVDTKVSGKDVSLAFGDEQFVIHDFTGSPTLEPQASPSGYTYANLSVMQNNTLHEGLYELVPGEKYYLETEADIILIHADILIPIVNNGSKRYFSLELKNGVWTSQSISEAVFKQGIIGKSQIDHKLTTTNGTLDLRFGGNHLAIANFASSPSLTVLQTSVIKGTPATKPTLSTTATPSTDVIAGNLTGQFSVSNYGEATYDVPLPIPAGINGFTPNLSLNYRSHNGYGQLGWGWSLSVDSGVHRCAKNLFAHGEGLGGGIYFNLADRLCWGNQPLLLKGTQRGQNVADSSYWGDGREYYVESEPGLLFRAIGWQQNEPNYFQAQGKDRVILFYGQGDAKRLHKIGTTQQAFSWALNRKKDSYGNLIDFQYQSDAERGSQYLSRISYGGQANGSHIYQIDLQYQTNPRVSSGYMGGSRYQSDRLLSRLDVSTDGEVQTRYQLGYEIVESLAPQAYLSFVQQCFRNGDCYPATRFDWTRDIEAPDIGREGSLAIKHQRLAVQDVTGDGRADLVYEGEDNAFYYYDYATQQSHKYSQSSNSTSYIAGFADVDADGVKDLLVGNTVAGLRAFYLDGNYFEFANSNAAHPYIMDANGDGRDDILISGQLRLAGSSGQANATIQNIGGGWALILGDLDGDGKDEFITYNEPWVETINRGGDKNDMTRKHPLAIKYKSNASLIDKYTPAPLSCTEDSCRVNANFSDVNGDGLLDRFNMTADGNSSMDMLVWLLERNQRMNKHDPAISLTLSINAGSQLIQDQRFDVKGDRYLLTDFNRDGLQDLLVHTGSKQWTILLASQDPSSLSISLTQSLQITAEDTLTTGDLDGDGQVELIGLPQDGKSVNIYRVAQPHSQLNRLRIIEEGLGQRYSLDYAPITDASVLTSLIAYDYYAANGVYSPSGKRLPGSFPYVLPLGGIYVVNHYQQSTADGGNLDFQLSYQGPLAHQQGGGWLGFNVVTRLNKRENSQLKQVYHQQPPLDGRLQSSEYRVDGKLVSLQVNDWQERSHELGGKLVYLASSKDHRYDYSTGKLVSQTDTQQSMDGWGNLLEQVRITGGNTQTHKLAYQDPRYAQPKSETLLFSEQGQSPGILERIDYLTYNEAGSVTQLSRQAQWEFNIAPPTDVLTEQLEYDAFGHLISQTRGNGSLQRTERWQYSSNGRLLASHTDAAGHTENYAYNGQSADSVKGQITLLGVTDANGLTDTQGYDLDGRLINQQRADGQRQQIGYELCENCTNGAAYRQIIETAGAPTQTHYFNPQGLPVEQQQAGFDGQLVTSQIRYDWRGQILSQTRPDYARQGENRTDYGYDPVGRKIRQEVHNGLGTAITQWAYNGNLIAVTDPLGRSRVEQYDALGRLLSSTDAAGNKTSFNYNARSQLLSAVPAGQPLARTSLSYDAWGRRTQLNDPSKGNWRYDYNIFGETIRQTDAKSQITQFQYDALGRLLSRRSAGGLDCFEYDTATHGKGQRASQRQFADGECSQSVVSSRYQRSYTYDAAGRLAGEQAIFKGQTLKLGYQYDEFGRQSVTRYPDAEGKSFAVRQLYNAYGYASELREEGSGQLIQRTDSLDAEGNLLRQTLGNQVELNNSYWAGTGLLQSAVDQRGSQQLLAQEYRYDLNANLTYRRQEVMLSAEARSMLEERFDYDAVNRLKQLEQQHQGQWLQSEHYSYDALGNIIQSQQGEYAYDANKPYRLQQQGSLHFTYDGNGNLLSDGERQLGYDDQDRTLSISKGEAITRFAYGPDGARYWREDVRTSAGKHSTLQTYYLDKVYEKQVRSGDEGALTEHKYYVGALVLTRRSNQTEDRLYQHLDSLGSVLLVSDQQGQPVQAFAYGGFGKQRSLILASRFASLLEPTRRGFTGHEMIADLDIVHMNGRIYDPALGRFLQADPFVPDPTDGQSYNRYAYVRNNPLNAVDPSGFWDSEQCKAEVRADNRRNGRPDSGDSDPAAVCNGKSNTLGARHNPDGSYRVYEKSPGAQEPDDEETEVEHGLLSVAVHSVLGALGGVPLVGAVADVADACLYGWQGDKTGMGLSLASAAASATPGLDQALAGAKLAHLGIVGRKAVKAVGEGEELALKVGDDVIKTEKGLGNPFKNKTAQEIDQMFKDKGFRLTGTDRINGLGGYVNPKTGRSYHIDPKEYGKYREPNHVDVNRLRSYKGPLDEKKKLSYKE